MAPLLAFIRHEGLTTLDQQQAVCTAEERNRYALAHNLKIHPAINTSYSLRA